MFYFEKYPIYLKAEKQYSEVLKVLSNSRIEKSLKSQLRRASSSIILNIAEGTGKYSKRDKRNFYVISRGSVNECVAIIRILKIENLIDEEMYSIIYQDLLEIAKMLTGLVKSMSQAPFKSNTHT